MELRARSAGVWCGICRWAWRDIVSSPVFLGDDEIPSSHWSPQQGLCDCRVLCFFRPLALENKKKVSRDTCVVLYPTLDYTPGGSNLPIPVHVRGF